MTLVERLREEPHRYEKRYGLSITAMEVWHKTACEAADEIELLRDTLRDIARRADGCKCNVDNIANDVLAGERE